MNTTILKRFWLSLESLRQQAATFREWQLALGPEWTIAQNFLRPTGQICHRFVRSSLFSRRCLASIPVISQDDTNFRAVPQDGLSFTVNAEELAMWELNRLQLATDIAAIMGCQQRSNDCSGDVLGKLSPAAGFQFGLCWIFPRSALQFLEDLRRVIVDQRSPFVLLVPTFRYVNVAAQQLLEREHILLIPLMDAVQFTARGSLVLAPEYQLLMTQFLRQHGPDPAVTREEVCFPTPPDANWEQVRMRFIDGETVSVVIEERSAMLNYTQLGMVNLRNGRPTVQWELLRMFATSYGYLDWDSPHADRKNQKRKELLSKQLRKFFGIDSEPFELDGNGWRTRFALTPD